MTRQPYFTPARYPGTCPQTGKRWARGDLIVWWPSVGKAYHETSPAGDHVRKIEAARAATLIDPNW